MTSNLSASVLARLLTLAKKRGDDYNLLRMLWLRTIYMINVRAWPGYLFRDDQRASMCRAQFVSSPSLGVPGYAVVSIELGAITSHVIAR